MPDAPTGDGRPVVLRGGTVLTVDRDRRVLPATDVLVLDGAIAALGPDLPVPDGALEVDATGGVVLPGMVDTHRHMWQTAMRGYGADWTLAQYFQWYYLQHGSLFRPQDVHAGNVLSALEAVDAGVTTTVDWSHGLRTVEHAEAAADALTGVPGRYVLACGNLHAAPATWTASPEFQAFVRRRRDEGRLALQLAFDVTGDPAFPERGAFEVARELGLPVTTHAGVWGASGDDAVRLVHENGFADPGTVYVHAASLSEDSYRRIAASGGRVSVAAESEQNAGQGYPPTWRLRRHGIDVSLSTDTSAWWSADMFSAMRATLGADRAREHLEAQQRGETVTSNGLRAEQVVEWATRGGARAIGREDDLGSVEVGKQADLVLVKNDASPALTPLLHPHGHVVLQAQRGDVHTVLVAGRLVKHEHRLLGVDLAAARREVERTVEHLRSRVGEEEWAAGRAPEVPETVVEENPYTYSEHRRSASAEG